MKKMIHTAIFSLSLLSVFPSYGHMNLDDKDYLAERYIDPVSGEMYRVSEEDLSNLPKKIKLVDGSTYNRDDLRGEYLTTFDLIMKFSYFGEGANTDQTKFASDSNGNYLISGQEYWFYSPKFDVSMGDVRTIAKNRIIGEKGNPDRPDKYKLYLKDFPNVEGLRLEYGDRVYFVNSEGTPLWFDNYTYVNHSKNRLFKGYTMGYATILKNPNYPEKLRLQVGSKTTHYDDFGRPTNEGSSSYSRTSDTFLELSYSSIFGRKTEGTYWLNANFTPEDWQFVPAN